MVPTLDSLGRVDIKDRVKAIRHALHLTQEQVAERSNGNLDRPAVVKVEAGKNKATTHQVRSGLASAFRLSLDEMSAYLDGRATLEETVRRAAAPKPPERTVERDEQFPSRAIAIDSARRLGGYSEHAIAQVQSMSRLPDWASGSNDLTARDWFEMIAELDNRIRRGGAMVGRVVDELDVPAPGPAKKGRGKR